MLIDSSPGDARPLVDDLPSEALSFDRAQIGWWCLVTAQAIVVIVLFILFVT
ncbi:hypothetical protein [Mycobacterium bourgelatii]|uniref:Uncharacterized protein n=1 Tax=Mycobacterium bourgelatii TaxID=1273442 RepID=A0A7I9YRK1_MYCBU|nr:hypothetical protein [Mycobacterium bourgelatii]MCV6974240.1 hypothetical protein [Mycobacterium bourgelatii]GFG91301.1 hypothetical protein MBOU_33430 [Mycobacterium bourgelatii]